MSTLDDKANELEKLADAIYDYNAVGGPLHVVLDDNNYQTWLLKATKAEIESGELIALYDWPSEAVANEVKQMSLRIIDILLSMPMYQRYAALQLQNVHYFDDND